MRLFEISSQGGLRAVITPFGARLVQLWAPDREGALADIVLGHDRAEDYLTYPTYFGATCGRYANRIAHGRFVLDGVAYQLDCNEGVNHLHGGRAGFDRKTWDVVSHDSSHIEMRAESPDGEMGYPGACAAQVIYRFEGERLQITMTARTGAPTARQPRPVTMRSMSRTAPSTSLLPCTYRPHGRRCVASRHG